MTPAFIMDAANEIRMIIAKNERLIARVERLSDIAQIGSERSNRLAF